MRLLVCLDCHTIDEVPDYEGPPEGDSFLETVVQKHRFPNGEEHRGNLVALEDEVYTRHKETVLQEIRKGLGSEGLASIDSDYYGTRDTFTEDALHCFNAHRRPEVCVDYKTKRKELPEPEGSKSLPVRRQKRYLCEFCLSGETEVVTRQGIRPIRDLVGSADLLVPFRTRGEAITQRGAFRKVEVRSFGHQPLRTVTLEIGPRGKTKVIRATPEHRWMLHDGSVATTGELRGGWRLKALNAVSARGKEHETPFAVAQGFAFGDGSQGHGRRPGFLTFYPGATKDKALLDYLTFPGFPAVPARVGGEDVLQVRGLPRHWKNLPPLDESRSFLFSWLAGYFAADGTVSGKGAASISSAVRENLEFVRSLAAICGVGTGFVTTKMREGFPGREPSALHQISLDVRDLPDWFWIHDSHRERVQNRLSTTGSQDRPWRVVSVEDHHEEEEVFCAIVPGVEAFGLADGLMTMNCPVETNVNKKKSDKGLWTP